MKTLSKTILMLVGLPLALNAQTRTDAGLRGDAGAVSGFFEAYGPVNYPAGATEWWHLLDVRHSNTLNNYAMQFSGSFFDQQLYFRKTMNNPSHPWSKVLLEIDGKVGIGTNDTKGYKLAVAGNVIAESIKVQLSAAWPDYVFAKSYQLPALSETEKFIKQNGHLPGIPSASEVKANGIDLGEMNALLLKKIEELTLHIIEMQKANELRDMKNDQEIKYLRSRIK